MHLPLRRSRPPRPPLRARVARWLLAWALTRVARALARRLDRPAADRAARPAGAPEADATGVAAIPAGRA